MRPSVSGSSRGGLPLHEELLGRLRQVMCRIGITRVADITGLDRLGVPVVMVCRPNGRSLSVSQGKGMDLDRARISGIMESLELWHTEHIAAPSVERTQASAIGDPRFLDLGPLRATGAVPDCDDLSFPWLEGRDLLSDGTVLVPAPLVSLDTRAGRRRRGWAASSNGLGAGADRSAAMLHGLLEVIERDALTLWQQRSPIERTLTRLDLLSAPAGELRALLERLEGLGMLVGAWDVTSDLGVPTVLVHLMAEDDEPHLAGGWEFGSAARLGPAAALQAALLEAIQARLTQIAGARDDIGRECYRPLEPSLVQAHRAMLARRGGRPLDRVPSIGPRSDHAALSMLLERLAAVGIDRCVVVDLMQPAIGIPVVKMIVPDLEDGIGIDGWKPGRRARAASAGSRR